MHFNVLRFPMAHKYTGNIISVYDKRLNASFSAVIAYFQAPIKKIALKILALCQCIVGGFSNTCFRDCVE